MSVKGGDIVYGMFGDPSQLKGDLTDAEKDIVKSMSSAADKSKKVISAMGAAVAGTMAGIAYKSIQAASEVNAGVAEIAASLGQTKEEAARFGDMIRTVYGDNFGESLADAGDAVKEVALQMKAVGVTGAKEIVQATEAAYSLQDAFDVGINESTNAAATLMRSFGMTSVEAFDFITAGFQKGLNASGDFVESIGEYANQFADGGATASQFFSVLETGMAGGVLGTDKAADAFKEFRVRILDGSKTTSDALALLGVDAATYTAQITSGQMTVADAFQDVITRLKGVGDGAVQMQAGVGLIGTQFEDLGQKIVLGMNLAATSTEKLTGSSASLGEQYKTLGNDWEGLQRKGVLASEAIGQAMLPVLHDLMNRLSPIVESTTAWIRANGPLTATIIEVVGAVATVTAVLYPLNLAFSTVRDTMAALKAGGALLAGAQGLGGVSGAVTAVTAVLTGPAGLAAALAATTVAVGFAIKSVYDYGDALDDLKKRQAAWANDSQLVQKKLQEMGLDFKELGLAALDEADQQKVAGQIIHEVMVNRRAGLDEMSDAARQSYQQMVADAQQSATETVSWWESAFNWIGRLAQDIVIPGGGAYGINSGAAGAYGGAGYGRAGMLAATSATAALGGGEGATAPARNMVTNNTGGITININAAGADAGEIAQKVMGLLGQHTELRLQAQGVSL